MTGAVKGAANGSASDASWEEFTAQLHFNPDRCIHSHSPIASCHACEGACPHTAWRLDGEGLQFDPDACDGCGLCVPACTESAICCTPVPAALPKGEKVWLLACAHSGVARPNTPCLHALSDAELVAQWHRGCREIHCARSDCERCPRASAVHARAGLRLEQRLERLNSALAQRRSPAMAWSTAEAAAWERCEKRQRENAPDLSRRGWLTRGMAAPAKAPDTRLPAVQAAQGPVPWPWQPRIDPVRCTACDACARLCPHQALWHHAGPGLDAEGTEEGGQTPGSAYAAEAHNCTGCGLCVDVCAERAIALVAWESAPALLRWPLREKTCMHCQAPFHVCKGGEQTHCAVCRQVRHPRAALRIVEPAVGCPTLGH